MCPLPARLSKVLYFPILVIVIFVDLAHVVRRIADNRRTLAYLPLFLHTFGIFFREV